MQETDLRVVKTLESIRESFLECLQEYGFLDLTVKNITEKARINRSTFYKYYADKYDLRDKYVDDVIRDFVDHLDIAFIYLPEITMENYFQDLRICLKSFARKKREYLILWNCNLQERNVFEEMIGGGVEKLMREFEKNSDISDEKQPFYSLYARLILGNMMVSVRWWFMEGQQVHVDEFTRMMICHMSEGIFPTLRRQEGEMYCPSAIKSL